jgi:hypothetical protein
MYVGRLGMSLLDEFFFVVSTGLMPTGMPWEKFTAVPNK